MTLQLVISDLDGTIVETEDYHRRAYNGLFEELGFDTRWTKQDYVNRLNVMGGGKLKEVFSWLNKPDSEYGKFKEETYLRKNPIIFATYHPRPTSWGFGAKAGRAEVVC